MFHDLELNWITFTDRSYTLQELQSALRKIFGHDGTMLLMQTAKSTGIRSSAAVTVTENM